MSACLFLDPSIIELESERNLFFYYSESYLPWKIYKVLLFI